MCPIPHETKIFQFVSGVLGLGVEVDEGEIYVEKHLMAYR